jgi:tetratricopeptide (TPR) repeat protein
MEPMELRCEQLAAEDVPSRYLAGELSEAERDAFEQHFFECERCHEAVRLCQALRNPGTHRPLRRRPRQWIVWSSLGVAAALLLAVAAGSFSRRQAAPARAPAAIQQSAPPSELLAGFTPPPYRAPLLRSTPDRPFAAAMDRYQRGDYAAAAIALRRLVVQRPGHQGAHFYLGICQLMALDSAGGIAELQQAVQLGGAAYLESARFYLAKAYLRRGNAADARSELGAIIALHGDSETQAREFLSRLDAAGLK